MRRLAYEVGFVTHPGNARPANQDSLLIRRGSVDGEDFLLLAVADGMGGLARGDEASALATHHLDRWWLEQLGPLLADGFDWDRIEGSLRAVLEAVNWEIFSASQGKERSGTTLSLLFLFRGEYRILQVGDSRIYLLRDGALRQLTEDQTWCRREVAAGRLTEDEIASHPMRHVLVSTLGVMAEYTLGRESGTLADGDAALVCSDGFYQELPAAWPGPNAQERPVQALLEDAVGQILTGPAPDNLSAAMVRAVRSRR